MSNCFNIWVQKVKVFFPYSFKKLSITFKKSCESICSLYCHDMLITLHELNFMNKLSSREWWDINDEILSFSQIEVWFKLLFHCNEPIMENNFQYEIFNRCKGNRFTKNIQIIIINSEIFDISRGKLIVVHAMFCFRSWIVRQQKTKGRTSDDLGICIINIISWYRKFFRSRGYNGGCTWHKIDELSGS